RPCTPTARSSSAPPTARWSCLMTLPASMSWRSTTWAARCWAPRQSPATRCSCGRARACWRSGSERMVGTARSLNRDAACEGTLSFFGQRRTALEGPPAEKAERPRRKRNPPTFWTPAPPPVRPLTGTIASPAAFGSHGSLTIMEELKEEPRVHMLRFIHAADIHLDSPLKGLEQYEGAPV